MMKGSGLAEADNLEMIKLRRRRQYEEERKERIFNARARIFGLDLDALERQKNTNRIRQHIKDEHERKYIQDAKLQRDVVYSRMLKENDAIKTARQELLKYRCLEQKFEDRREFDINNPRIIKDAKPVRTADVDPNLGISSAQVFDGEDLHNAERMKQQIRQNNAYIKWQKKERKDAKDCNERENEARLKEKLFHDSFLTDLAKVQNELIDETVLKYRDMNLELAREKHLRDEKRAKDDYEDNLAEIYNNMTSDMLTENPDVAQSKTNPYKKVAYMYRRMNDEELKNFRREQYITYKLISQRKDEGALWGQKWETYNLHNLREQTLKAEDIDIFNHNLLLKHVDYNRQLSIEQRQRNEENVKRRNEISDEFYDQFNKDIR